jgi:hypothetical protein
MYDENIANGSSQPDQLPQEGQNVISDVRSYACFRIQWHEFLYLGLFFIIAVHFPLNLSKTGLYFLDINKFMSGKAEIPYQYRVLMIPLFKGLIGQFGSFDLTAILSGIWWAIKLPLLALVAGVGSDAPIGRITNFQPVYNFTTLLKPWQWPALSMLFIPVILTIWFLFEKPSKKALDWILPYIFGFSMIFSLPKSPNIDPMGI